jgi:Single-strand binding protein family
MYLAGVKVRCERVHSMKDNITFACPHCGVIDTPQQAPGKGPYAARLVCRQCHGFLKWLPKPRTEGIMFALNERFLAGTLASDPETSFTNTGTQVTSTRLCIAEAREGQVYRTWIPVEGWNKSADALAALQEGDTVLVKGKLKWKSSAPRPSPRAPPEALP